MALQIKFCVPQDCDCKSVNFSDTTGVYDASTNPTGYGTPNPESADVTQARITFNSPNDPQGIDFVFTVLNNVITDATRTDSFGNTVNVLADLPSTVFPFVDFVFDSPLLYGSDAQSDLLDGAWKVLYQIDEPSASYSYSAWVYLVCQIKKCYEETMVGFTKGTVLKSNAIDVSLNFDSLVNAVGLDNPTSVNNLVEVMQSLCSNCNKC